MDGQDADTVCGVFSGKWLPTKEKKTPYSKLKPIR